MKSTWKVDIEDLKDNCFRIYREDVEGVEDGTLLTFDPIDTDLPIEMVRKFAEDIVKYWNTRGI